MNQVGHRPLISIVTVCLNADEYIRQCIESVIGSDFDDFEYVVIDGGSIDHTVEIIREYDERIAYWSSKPDRGLAHAFNQGVEHSRGQWLLYLNADDYLAGPDRLRQIAGKLVSNPSVDVVFGQILMVARTQDMSRISGPHGAPFSWDEFLRRDSIPHQAAFTNRRFFERVGAFDERYRSAVDYEHYLRGGRKLRCVFVPLVVAHQRDGGLSRENVRRTLHEWFLAQVRSGGRNSLMAWLNYAYLVARSTLGVWIRSMVGVLKS